jgi:hypothetical protein
MCHFLNLKITNFMNKKTGLISGIVLLVYIILLMSCSKMESTAEPIVVAEIGDRTITARDFQLNYEFGFASLKKGDTTRDRKRSYLQWMIYEKLLAIEGFQRGLHKSDAILFQQKSLEEDLILESFLTSQIKSKITISDTEIKEAITKSKVQFKFRYWPASTLEDAEVIFSEMKTNGFSDVVSFMLETNPETGLKIEDFTTDYVTWLEIPDEVLSAIQDVPRGEISEPVKIKNTYFLFQVLDIRREAITENEYLSKAPTFKKILEQKEYRQAVRRYVNGLMTPKKVITKGAALRMLSDALLEWKRAGLYKSSSFLECVENADPELPALYTLKSEQDMLLSTFEGSQLTVGEFLKQYNGSRFQSVMRDTNRIRAEMSRQIALHIRNLFLLKEARSLSIDKDPAIQDELALWLDKWVGDALTAQLLEPDSAQSLKSIYTANKQLSQTLDVLETKYPVKIYHNILDTLSVNETNKSAWLNMHIFKGGTNRIAVPIANGYWALQDSTRL